MARSAFVSRDGKSNTDQGGYFPHQSVGSNTTRADLDWLYNYWGVLQQQFAEPVRRDLNGVPFRLCGLGDHYSPVAAFDAGTQRPDGLKPDCRQCLQDQAEKAARVESQLEAEKRARHTEHERKKRRMLRTQS